MNLKRLHKHQYAIVLSCNKVILIIFRHNIWTMHNLLIPKRFLEIDNSLCSFYSNWRFLKLYRNHLNTKVISFIEEPTEYLHNFKEDWKVGKVSCKSSKQIKRTIRLNSGKRHP